VLAVGAVVEHGDAASKRLPANIERDPGLPTTAMSDLAVTRPYHSWWIDRQRVSHYVPENRIKWGLLRMRSSRAAARIWGISRDFTT
jgi:hypothetical protein